MPALEENPDLALLLAAAAEAGEIAKRRFRRPQRMWEKPAGEGLVTEADLEIDEALRARLLGARPGWGWLSEETERLPTLSTGARGSSTAAAPEAEGDAPDACPAPSPKVEPETLFIIDPIDGTRAFAGGDSRFSHALAIVRAGAPVAAVVHLPLKGLTYYALAGHGAWLNGRPIYVSGRADPEGARVLASRASLDPAHWPGGTPQVKRAFRPSLAWRLALVAEGAFDAALSLGAVHDWDIAAGSLIAAEAGALVTDAKGQPLRFAMPQAQNKGLLVAPPALHQALARAMHPHAFISEIARDQS